MSAMFRAAKSFNGDISEWDVSRVATMNRMFRSAASFNGDLSKWDVSHAQDMSSMFNGAELFNGELSEWDVSSVTNMDRMFRHTFSFHQKLCGAAWGRSKASKRDMFAGSRGSISRTVRIIPKGNIDLPYPNRNPKLNRNSSK